MRSAIVAGVLAGATVAGCGDAKPAVEDPSHKVGPSPTDSDAMAAGPVEGERDFARDPDEEDKEEVREVEQDMPPMPYGAPPARRRLV